MLPKTRQINKKKIDLKDLQKCILAINKNLESVISAESKDEERGFLKNSSPFSLKLILMTRDIEKEGK